MFIFFFFLNSHLFFVFSFSQFFFWNFFFEIFLFNFAHHPRHHSDWKLLYKSLRKSDINRTGCVDQGTFAYHLMEFGVPLTGEELLFLATTMGKSIRPTHKNGMSLTRAQSATLQRGRRRPSTSALPGVRTRTWGNSLRRSVAGRPQSAMMRRSNSVKSMGSRHVNYSAFMKGFVLTLVGGHNITTMQRGSTLGSINPSLLM